MAVGLLFAGLSTTPSLLPRSALEQGIIAAVSFGVGYALGTTVSAAGRRFLPNLPRGSMLLAWAVVLVGAAVAAIPTLTAYRSTQSDLHLSVGGAAVSTADVLTAVGIAAAGSLLLVVLGRAVVAIHGRLTRLIARRWGGSATAWNRAGPPAAAMALMALAMAVIVGSGVTGLAISVQAQYDAYNASYDPNIAEPSGAYRSAGPESVLSWERTGREGRRVLGTGPSAHDIESLTGKPAKQPIRVYVGLQEPGDWDAHAAAAVAELERLGAQDRDALVVAATTGTGWLDPQAIDAVEYLNDGDTALVAMQYSVTESWHSVLFHPDAHRASTMALLTAVHQWWSALPDDHRPRLYLYGLSLGSRAIQESIPDADALRAFGNGVVLAGTPSGTVLNAGLTARRDPGSPVTVPVLDGGARYRWFADALDIQETEGTWERPRVAFLQHGTDPIVWIGLPILWSRPEWLEPAQRSSQIHPEMEWYPVVSAVQSVFDIAEDLTGPDGVGHRYGTMALEAWIAVAGDGGLAPDILDAIRQRVTGGDLPAGSGA